MQAANSFLQGLRVSRIAKTDILWSSKSSTCDEGNSHFFQDGSCKLCHIRITFHLHGFFDIWEEIESSLWLDHIKTWNFAQKRINGVQALLKGLTHHLYWVLWTCQGFNRSILRNSCQIWKLSDRLAYSWLQWFLGHPPHNQPANQSWHRLWKPRWWQRLFANGFG